MSRSRSSAGTGGREPDGPLAGRRVLLVEDQFIIANDLKGIVIGMGGEVVGPFPSTEPALAALEAGAIDLGLLDINLNGGRVYPVAEALRAKGAPFAFLTGYEKWMIDPRFADAPHLEKPVDPESLADFVAGLWQGDRA